MASPFIYTHSSSLPSAETVISAWLDQGDYDVVLCLEGFELTELPDSFPFHLVKKLNCCRNKLTSLSLPVATHVWCEYNRLKSLSLPMAVDVQCGWNQLTCLSLPMATRVRCYRNHLMSLILPLATDVECNQNQLNSLSLPMAIDVYCQNNQLTTLSLPSVKLVECDNNKLISLSFPVAIYVSCNDNQLVSLSLPIATTVFCSNNRLMSIPFLPRVQCLKLQDNELEYLLSGLLGDKLRPLVSRGSRGKSVKCYFILRKWKWKVKAAIRQKKAAEVHQSEALDGVRCLADIVASYV